MPRKIKELGKSKKTFSKCDDLGLPLFMAKVIHTMGPRLDSRQWNMMLLYNVSRRIILHEVKLLNRKLENKFIHCNYAHDTHIKLTKLYLFDIWFTIKYGVHMIHRNFCTYYGCN